MKAISLVDPTNGPEVIVTESAPRLRSLEGTTVGLLDIGKNNADVILGAIGNSLVEQWGVRELIWKHKNYTSLPSGSQPAPSSMLDELARECDAVIVGVGD